MTDPKQVEKQLTHIGFNWRAWGRGEVRELSRVIADDEEIKHCCNGHYQGGFAMLVATNQRLLLIDRKPMFLTIEAIWYDKIGQVDYNHRLFNATICISTPNKDLTFTSWNHSQLRGIMFYSQEMMTATKELESEYRHRSSEVVQPPAAIKPVPAGEPSAPSPSPSLKAAVWQAPTPTAVALYAANRLPFTRRRYYAPPVSSSGTLLS